MRTKLPDRRYTETCNVEHQHNNGVITKLVISYGIENGKVTEAFCASFKAGSDMMSLVIDASILLSRVLQHGDDLQQISNSLCKPDSVIGTIVRNGLTLEEAKKETDE